MSVEDFTKLLAPRDHIDRDLQQLAGTRVSEALSTVLQLAPDREGAMRILLGGFIAASAAMSAAYNNLNGGTEAGLKTMSDTQRLNISIDAMKALRDMAVRFDR